MNDSYSLREASKVAQVSISTVRRWINAGLISASKKGSRAWSIQSSELHNFLSSNSERVHGASKSSSDDNNELFRMLLEESKEALQRERRISDELRIELKNAQSEVRKLEIEIKALLEQKGGTKLKSVLSRWIKV